MTEILNYNYFNVRLCGIIILFIIGLRVRVRVRDRVRVAQYNTTKLT